MKQFAFVFALAWILHAQVPFDRIRDSAKEPQNWLTYNNNLYGTHYSALDQITPLNIGNLNLNWVYQIQSLEKFEATPLVVDGVMYISEPPNDVSAVDVRTGRPFWTYHHQLSGVTGVCCGWVNRGVAILGNTVFMGTLDAHLTAIDASTGRRKWETVVADSSYAYALTLAPLVVKNLVIVGPSGGERGIGGFLAAYDAETGKQVWRFHTIPQPGEPNFGTWAGDSWKTGGASAWVTGSYDAGLNLLYWGIGNPGPDWNTKNRGGDNLYSDSVVALDADTGKLKWYFQFTPQDEWDYDSVQVPVLIDITWQRKPVKAMVWGNRNGYFYLLDRETGKFLLGKPFVKQTWSLGLDDNGRPKKNPDAKPSLTGTDVYPGVQGGTNWYAPSYSPRTKLFYITAWEDYHTQFFSWDQEYEPGKGFTGGMAKGAIQSLVREPYTRWAKDSGYGTLRALNPLTGERVWEYPMQDVSDAGILTTGSDLLFSGNREGYFFALDARTGKELWKRYLGLQVAASPVTYMVDGKQYIAVAAGHAIFTFALPSVLGGGTKQ